jgi:hypothetical protein
VAYQEQQTGTANPDTTGTRTHGRLNIFFESTLKNDPSFYLHRNVLCHHLGSQIGTLYFLNIDYSAGMGSWF